MRIEFVIEGDKYQELIKDIVPIEKEKIKFFSESKKIAGVNNHLVSVQAVGTVMTSAKLLSQIAEQIKSKLIDNKVKFYMLVDEPSAAFVQKLYPLVCEFETKLRKFVYITLFDLDDTASQLALNKFKAVSNKEFKARTTIPNNNFLEKLTLGELFYFLFDNNEFITEAKSKTTSITNDIDRTATKAELIAIIDAIEEKTVWKMLFSKNFSDFSLPEVHRDIFSLRNDVMHFHNVTYETYRKALILFKKINTELDVQLDKGIVLENKSENVELISLQYFNAILTGLRESINVIRSNFDAEKFLAIRELVKSMQSIKYDAEIETMISFAKFLRDNWSPNDLINNICDKEDADENKETEADIGTDDKGSPSPLEEDDSTK